MDFASMVSAEGLEPSTPMIKSHVLKRISARRPVAVAQLLSG